MPTDIAIRTAVVDDVAKLTRVFVRSSLSNDGDRDLILAHAEVWLVYDDEHVRAGHTRVALVDGAIVGFATLLPGDVGELEDLFVDPDWMRRGIATALIDDAAARARSWPVPRIEVTANEHALAFYESAGFVAVGRERLPSGGTAPRMHLTLG
jgi:GNAT superfamily N-acetyltransferase